MDFELTEEQKMFWEAIAGFCDKEIAPRLLRRKRAGFFVAKRNPNRCFQRVPL